MLVAHNENDNAQAFAVQEGDQRFTYTLPGDSLATFVWPGSATQYVRITLTTADPNDWWSVADVRAYVAGGLVADTE